MNASIKKTPAQITEEEITEIYKLFCQAFEIKYYPHGEDYFRNEGLKELREKGVTSYSSERSIFTAVYEGNGVTRFNGCSTVEDPLYTEKIGIFRKLMKEKYKNLTS